MIIVIDTDLLNNDALGAVMGALYANDAVNKRPLSDFTKQAIEALAFRTSYTENDIIGFMDNCMKIDVAEFAETISENLDLMTAGIPRPRSLQA